VAVSEAGSKSEARRRRWADVVILVASIYAIVMAVWAPPAAGPGEAAAEAADHGAWWWAHAIGASMALSSIFVAFRSITLARVLAGVGALVLLAGVVAFRDISWLAVRTLILPAVLILIATPFMGPMPTPEDEGKVRRGLGDR
jgi:hypothetical protein